MRVPVTDASGFVMSNVIRTLLAGDDGALATCLRWVEIDPERCGPRPDRI